MPPQLLVTGSIILDKENNFLFKISECLQATCDAEIYMAEGQWET
jgi:hypothetical protein